MAVLDDQEREATELQRLEAEHKQRLAQFESENLARQQAMEDKRRKLERLEEVKKLNAARARVKVYDQVQENLEVNNLLDDSEPAGGPQTQVLQASGPPFIPQSSTKPPMLQVTHSFFNLYQFQVKVPASKVCNRYFKLHQL